MRLLICATLIPLCLLAQTSNGLFPIPAMQEQWPGSGLSDTENRLLEKIIKADLGCPSAASKDVPDLVFASNSSIGENDLTLYRYENGNFILRKCERLLAKGDGTPKNWWDPSEVNVRTCDGS